MLIFDSGIGGLSILNHIKKILPNMNYIYMLDNQAFPYGNKKKSFIIERSITIIQTIKKKYPIKMVIIACNTASTIGLSILRKKFTFPIIGIFPDIKSAKQLTKNKIIGLIATRATIHSYYTKNIVYHNDDNFIKIIATNKLALIAEKKIRGVVAKKKELQKIFKIWTTLSVQPDTIILGCTHFLFLKKEIKEILYKSIYFIDSTEKMVCEIKKCLKQLNIKQNIKENIIFYSKKNDNFKQLLSCLKKYCFQKIKYINLN
ncbi:glutamate racemase [Buchnera aphidicola]|uniref:glutamate racemase n=1 Tax=Buchnera aphidicola TaxID=9 RepID=UPI0034641C7A